MWNDRTLEADIEYAAEMVLEGLATVEQAAQACGIPLANLQSHVAGGDTSDASHYETTPASDLKGSAQSVTHKPRSTPDTESTTRPPSAVGDATAESTDYFVFYREESRWVWKRVDPDGNVVKTCEGQFPLYLDCVADARPHGFAGRPLFVFAASDIGAPDLPEKPR